MTARQPRRQSPDVTDSEPTPYPTVPFCVANEMKLRVEHVASVSHDAIKINSAIFIYPLEMTKEGLRDAVANQSRINLTRQEVRSPLETVISSFTYGRNLLYSLKEVSVNWEALEGEKWGTNDFNPDGNYHFETDLLGGERDARTLIYADNYSDFVGNEYCNTQNCFIDWDAECRRYNLSLYVNKKFEEQSAPQRDIRESFSVEVGNSIRVVTGIELDPKDVRDGAMIKTVREYKYNPAEDRLLELFVKTKRVAGFPDDQ